MMKPWYRLLKGYSYTRYLNSRNLLSRELHDRPSTQKAWTKPKHPRSRYSDNNNTTGDEIKNSKSEFRTNYPKPKQTIYTEATLAVLGSGSAGTTPSVSISYSKDFWFLFNEGQGLTRTEKKSRGKFQSLKNIFFTSSSWRNICGLFFSNDHLKEDIIRDIVYDHTLNIHGPPSVKRCLEHMKSQHNLKIEHYTVDPTKSFCDKQFVCEYVLLHPKVNTSIEKDGRETTVNKDHAETLEILQGFRQDGVDEVAAYIIKPNLREEVHLQRGKISMRKCMELGLQAQELRLLLQEGFYDHPDGRVIHRQDIEEVPPASGSDSTVIILECPSEDYFDSLLSEQKFLQYQRGTGDNVDIIVHMTPHDVSCKPEYKIFMNRFGKKTRHLMLNERASPMLVPQVYSRNSKLNFIHNDIFPLLPMQGTDYSSEKYLNEKIVPGQSGLIFNLVRKTFDHTHCMKGDYDPMSSTELVGSDYAEYKDMKDRLEKQSSEEGELYPELVFLGTGASRLTKVRSESCILLHISANSIFMLDCGEDSYAQLCQFYTDQSDEILMKIDAIFISHNHKDHKKGLFNILLARKKAFDKVGMQSTNVYILGPTAITFDVQWFQQNFESLGDFVRFLSLQHIREIKGKILHKLRFQEIVPVKVNHTGPSFGVVLRHKTGWTVVYSGDTMPCEALVNAGRDCDILIHEGTYGSDEIDRGLITKHSTRQQAILSGFSMGAKYTILTHLGTSFDQQPAITIPAKYKHNVIFAYDFMKVRAKDLPNLPMMQQPIKTILHCYETPADHDI